MTWWAWALSVWVLVSLPAALLVGRVLRGPAQPAHQRRPSSPTTEDVDGLGDVATSRAVRGRLIRG